MYTIKTQIPEWLTEDGKISPEYRAWAALRHRCSNPNFPAYKYYGGRGIAFCERWGTFENFYADMGPRPSPDHSVERIDNDGNYEPSNCRWATKKEQCRNKRSNRRLVFGGHDRCLEEWAEILQCHRSGLMRRLKRGWSVERTLTTPITKGMKCRRKEKATS